MSTQIVGETHLSEIVDAIVNELRPHRRPKRDVQESLRGFIAPFRAEVAQLQRRLKGTPAKALEHLEKLEKCAAELEKLLLRMPNRIAWVGEMRSGLLGVSYEMAPERRLLIQPPLEHPSEKLMNFISDLERLQTAAKIAKKYRGPSPLYEVEKHLSAKYARLLIVALSKKPPTSAGPLRTIAGLLFEVITGEKDANLERHCKAELKAAAGQPDG
jgi:hypothetical protein